MSLPLKILSITSGYRPIRDGRPFESMFGEPDNKDSLIIRDGIVEQTVELMKKVVFKYLDDTKKIAAFLKNKDLETTCNNIWSFLYNHIQYKLDKKGLEQLRRPVRSWSERFIGIDCDCFSIFVSSILTNLNISHKFRITKYDEDFFQHVYVVVPDVANNRDLVIDCVISQFNYEKPFTEKIDFAMSLNGINVAVLSGITANVMDLVNDLEGIENLGADNEQERLETIYAHLVKTRNMIADKPQYIQDIDYPPAFLNMLDYAIVNWNTPNRDKALAILAQNEDALNKHFQMSGIAENSDEEGLDDDWSNLDGLSDVEIAYELNGKKRKQKKAQNKNQAKKKGFFKKVGEAVKKGGKAFVRYNPLTISARNGFLLALKLNIKKMASKLKWGYATKEQATAKGISADIWEKSKNALAKVEKLFADKLQGKRDKLKSAILKGKAGGLSGIDGEEDFDISGLGAAPAAAAMAAAVPVIASCLKILVESGVMNKNEAEDLQTDIDKNVTEGDQMLKSDEEFKDEPDNKKSTKADETDDDSDNDEGGFVGWVKKNPLLALGIGAGSILGITLLFRGSGKKEKEKSEKGLSGTETDEKPKSKAKKTKKSQSKAKSRSRENKIQAIRLS